MTNWQPQPGGDYEVSTSGGRVMDGDWGAPTIRTGPLPAKEDILSDHTNELLNAARKAGARLAERMDNAMSDQLQQTCLTQTQEACRALVEERIALRERLNKAEGERDRLLVALRGIVDMYDEFRELDNSYSRGEHDGLRDAASVATAALGTIQLPAMSESGDGTVAMDGEQEDAT